MLYDDSNPFPHIMTDSSRSETDFHIVVGGSAGVLPVKNGSLKIFVPVPEFKNNIEFILDNHLACSEKCSF